MIEFLYELVMSTVNDIRRIQQHIIGCADYQKTIVEVEDFDKYVKVMKIEIVKKRLLMERDEFVRFSVDI